MTFGSLFAGIGGLDLGLERAGMKCRWQVEIDPFCRQVLEKHWPEVPKYGDITELIGDELELVDLICGGFPCQDLSQAGKRTGIEGSRSSLWFEFARIVGVVGPHYILIENVPGLLVRDAMRRVVGELAGLGYVGWWRSLRASEFGASHLRKRVFIIAVADGEHQGRIVSGEAYNGDGHHASGNHTDGCNPIVDNSASAPGGSEFATEQEGEWRTGPERADGTLADAGHGLFSPPGWRSERRDGPGSAGEILPNTCSTGLPDTEQVGANRPRRRHEGGATTELRGALANGAGLRYLRHAHRERETEYGPEHARIPIFAPGPADPRWPAILAVRPDLAPALESPVRGVADGIPDRLDGAMRDRTKRLGRLGNAVVPQVAEWIGRRILEIEAQK